MIIQRKTNRKLMWAVCSFATVLCVTPAMADSDTPTSQEKPSEMEAQTEQNDPFEDVNRVTSGFNRFFRKAILDPVVDGYKAVTPEPIQDGIGGIVSNLTEPVTAVSSLLQGDTENAGIATKRFLINSTVGVAGMADPASDMGLEQRREDLGQAAAVNGTGAGPYIVIPFLGPSNSRDLVGDVVTSLVSPIPVVVGLTRSGVEYSDNKEDINAITDGALDAYSVERSAYRQNRKFKINNGEIQDYDIPTLDELDQ